MRFVVAALLPLLDLPAVAGPPWGDCPWPRNAPERLRQCQRWVYPAGTRVAHVIGLRSSPRAVFELRVVEKLSEGRWAFGVYAPDAGAPGRLVLQSYSGLKPEAFEATFRIKRPVRGRPPKGENKYRDVHIRLHPKALQWARAQGTKRGIGYQTIINETLLHHAV